MYYSGGMTAEAFDPTPPRERQTNILPVRLSDGGWEWVEARMDEYEINQTEVVKAALALASAKPQEFAKLIKARKGNNT